MLGDIPSIEGCEAVAYRPALMPQEISASFRAEARHIHSLSRAALVRYLKACWSQLCGELGVTKREGQQSEKVLLRFPKDEYPYVATKPWHGSQKKIAEDDTSVTIELDVVINYELEQKILSWGEDVEVVSPLFLRTSIHKRIINAHSNYQ